jgi:uncharacterized membrane protein YoaK (UPF0700 family)
MATDFEAKNGFTGAARGAVALARDVTQRIEQQKADARATNDAKAGANTLIKLLSPDARAEKSLAVHLAVMAGYIDAYGLIAYGTYVSFMSGNTTQTGSLIGQGRFQAAVPSALAIVFFVAGSFAGTWLTHSSLRHSRQVLFGIVAASLMVIIGGTRLGTLSLHAQICIAMLGLAMGLMNSTLSRIGAEPVSLTFVTGTLNKLGGHLAQAVRRESLPDAQGPRDTHLRRAGLMASVWAGFIAGAIVSGAATSYFGVWVLLPPFLILLALALSPDNVATKQRARLPLRQRGGREEKG